MRCVLVSAIVVCASLGLVAQAPSTTVSDDQRQLAAVRVRLSAVAVQLAGLGKQLVQEAQDINEMARPLTSDCERFHTLMNVSAQADEASSRMDGVSDLLDMYLSISTSNDRLAAGKVLTKHVAEAEQYLETQIKLVNLSLSAPSLPAGAAVTATRIRDNIRSAIELFDKVKPQ